MLTVDCMRACSWEWEYTCASREVWERVGCMWKLKALSWVLFLRSYVPCAFIVCLLLKHHLSLDPGTQKGVWPDTHAGFPTLRLQTYHYTGLLCGCWSLNSEPPACITSPTHVPVTRLAVSTSQVLFIFILVAVYHWTYCPMIKLQIWK